MLSDVEMNRRISTGFSLIEMVIAIAIIGILMGLATPSFIQWIRNSQVRNQAESVLYGIQQARTEAIKRNAIVRFQLVTPNTAGTTLDNSCAVTQTSNFWIVSHGDPTSKCGNAESLQNADTTSNNPYSTTPVLLLKGLRENRNTVLTTLTVTGVATPDQIICFNGTGRLERLFSSGTNAGQCTTSSNPGITATPSAQIDITNPTNGTCTSAGGSVRCLRLQISPNGEARMCDPAVTSANDPRICS